MVTVAACVGCDNVEIGRGISLCKIWAAPHAKHRLPDGCPSKTNKAKKVVVEKKVNALKASKRAAAGK
jgi:hypothetical protein